MQRVIIDVREPYEYAQGHVSGALNVPPADLMAGAGALRDIPKDAEIILYCLSGSRSNASMHYLRQLGYANLTNGINKEHVEAQFLDKTE